MNSNSKHKNWQQKLGHWLSGDANRRDELHLEEMARDDTFLADAIEGYRSLPEDNHTRKVTQMKAKLRQQNQQKQGVVWMKTAAIGAFLVLALFELREYNQSLNVEDSISQKEVATTNSSEENEPIFKKDAPKTTPTKIINPEEITNEPTEKIVEKRSKTSTPNFAQKKTKTKSKASKKLKEEVTTFDYSSTADAVTFQDAPPSQVLTATNNSAAFTTTPSSSNPNSSNYPNDPGAPEVFVEKPTPSPLNEEEFDKAFEPVILSAANDISTDNVLEESAEPDSFTNNSYIGHVVKGKVLSQRGEPLIGANVIITGTPAGTTTDFDGDFTLNVPANASIDIQYLGYKDLRVDLQHQDDLKISMEVSDIALESVAIASRKSSSEKTKKRSMDTVASKEMKQENVKVAAPKMGVLKFEKYIQQNRRYPEEAKENNVSDTVVVQFKVKENGALTDFKILKSVGFGCDEEAIRLLKDGPKWETEIDTVLNYEIGFKDW
ncbi:MAG: TonB family protein [Paraglaciecola sp.]|jgi:TonB family protein